MKALLFGLGLNGGETCIAPRRIFVARRLAERLEAALSNEPAVPTFPEVQVIDSDAQALALLQCSPHALGAAIFSRDAAAARRLAGQIPAGVVTINDLIFPIADPRLPFGGRRQSGFGVTRGAEGLLAMTVPKVVTTTRGSARRHYAPAGAAEAELFVGYIAAVHGGRAGRLAAWTRLGRALANFRKKL